MGIFVMNSEQIGAFGFYRRTFLRGEVTECGIPRLPSSP
jgi:hypothetical protein